MKKEKKTTIALTWGATWGHIFPLLSAYNFLKEDENLDFVWVWEEEWLEFDIAMENNIKFLDIPAWKLRRYFDWRNFFEPLKNLTWIFFGIYFILRYRIKVIFSKGGYVALPLCIAGFLLRRKIYIHESDTVSGLANRIIWKMATKVFYTFPNEKTEDINNQKHIFTGQILNPEILTGIRNMKVEENMFLNVIVIAWSQGSTRIFENVLKVISKLDFVDFTVILWEKNTHFKKSFEKYGNVRTFDFISQKDLWKILKQTDIAITRAWATTLWELAMFWIHSLIVPLTESAWNHQMANAEFFHNKFWSDILDENNNLEKNILEKLTKYKNLRKAWLNLNDFFRPLEIIESEILWKNIDYKKEKIEQFEKDMAEINRADALEKLKKLENERLARNKETSKKIEQENTEKEKQENEFKIEEISQAKTNFQTFSIR